MAKAKSKRRLNTMKILIRNGGEIMTNKKFKHRKPMAARTVAADYDHCIDTIAHALKTLTENEAFKEAAAEAERVRASR